MSPVLWVLQPETDVDDCPQWRGSGFVYAKHILWRSWLALQDIDVITIPDDIEPLIECVYDDDRPCPQNLPAAWKSEWDTTRQQLFAGRDEAEMEAKKRLIKPPGYNGELSAITQSALDEEDTTMHQTFQAVTRLGPPTVSVVCLFQTPEGYRLGPRGDVVVISPDASNGIIKPSVIESIIRRSVSLSHRAIVRELLAESRIPVGWQKTAMLRQQHLLLFDEHGRALHFPLEIYLDPELGVIFNNPIDFDDI
jgi:CRISPR-associated endonuclease/helicase Cas3